MKLALGFKITDGPWGGGNQFAKSVTRYLEKKGWDVVFDLKESDIDMILMTDPRENSLSASFSVKEIKKYLKKYPDTVVVHRVNECDERKKTDFVNDQLMEANQVAHHTIFISDWLRELFCKYKKFDENNSSVVRNGADNSIFNRTACTKWNGNEPLKLVTHHWGANWMKGFDIYEIVDGLAGTGYEGVELEFTYIGNVPEGFSFNNSRVLGALSGKPLADAISKNHVYLTGSQNEPGGMHHVEGCLCGLPPVYRISGALTEHCRDFGVGFHGPDDFRSALKEMVDGYSCYSNRMKNYPYTSEKMNSEYEAIFRKLLNNRKKIKTENKGLLRKFFTGRDS